MSPSLSSFSVRLTPPFACTKSSHSLRRAPSLV
jgi:hypothetical protein